MYNVKTLPPPSLLKSILGFVISGVLLWLTIRKSGLEIENVKLQTYQVVYFVIALITFVLATWIQSIRAKLLWISRNGKVIKVNTYSSLVLGNFYNCILPGNLGEGVRALHFSKKNNVPFQNSLASIITEKWIDALIFVPIVGLLLSLKPITESYIIDALLLTTLMIVLLFIVFVTFQLNIKIEKTVWRIVLKFGVIGKYLFKLYKKVVEQLRNLMKSGLIFPYIVLCACFFIGNIIQFLFLLKAAGIDAPIGGLYTAFLIAICIMIIVIVPSAPSNIGVLHYGIYLTLILASHQLGFSPQKGDLQSFALFSILLHLSYLLPEITLGLLYMIKERKTLFELL